MVGVSWGTFPSGSYGLERVLVALRRYKWLNKLYLRELRGLWASSKEFARVKEAKFAAARGQRGDIEVIFV